jgi:hypothetical protein
VLVSYVVRLMPEPLADGRLVGEVEAVETGERWRIRDADDLLSVLIPVRKVSDRRPGPGGIHG